MHRYLLFAALVVTPVAVYAQVQPPPDRPGQPPPPDPQPITLSVQEYQALLNMAIQRDPLASLLLQKQAEAQAAAKQKAQDPKKP